jgi:hypothetical protein
MAPPVRLIVCDFYMAPPKQGLDPTYNEFRGVPVTQVPVLRVFGSTLTGLFRMGFVLVVFFTF